MSKEIEIEYEFDPTEYEGKRVFAFATAIIVYSTHTDSWDYPLASAGTCYEDRIEVEAFDLILTVTDEYGEVLYEDDDVPSELRDFYHNDFDR